MRVMILDQAQNQNQQAQKLKSLLIILTWYPRLQTAPAHSYFTYF